MMKMISENEFQNKTYSCHSLAFVLFVFTFGAILDKSSIFLVGFKQEEYDVHEISKGF